MTASILKKRSKTHKRLKERFLIIFMFRFVLFRIIKKRSFSLLCVLDLQSLTVKSWQQASLFTTLLIIRQVAVIKWLAWDTLYPRICRTLWSTHTASDLLNGNFSPSKNQ